jgi:predicted acylesterase/phospholipase RssA
MSLLSRRPRWKSKKNKKRKILVISWWWFRWTYALWIMKALEETGVKDEIDAIYWVSIWAIIWSVRSNWTKAEDIQSLLTDISVKDFYSRDILKKSWGLVSSTKISKMLDEHLPKSFDSLTIPFYAWAVDTNTAEFHIFHEWDLRKIVLWSMSIPWVFPPVKYWKYSLVDGWVLNNFPVNIAKLDYPNHEIIWIALNKFQTNQKISSVFDSLIIVFEVMMRSKLLKNTKLVDYLFYRDLPISIMSLNKKQMRDAFALWYEDWIKMFKKD